MLLLLHTLEFLRAGRACGGMLNLYIDYDECTLAEPSRDLTMFQMPFRALHLTILPMGWTNSVPIFHDNVTHILRPEVPHLTVPYIDNIPVKGLPSAYCLEDGTFEMTSNSPSIQHFIWEHFEALNRIVQQMKYSGGTFSGYKLTLCVPEITVLGYYCMPYGCLPDST